MQSYNNVILSRVLILLIFSQETNLLDRATATYLFLKEVGNYAHLLGVCFSSNPAFYQMAQTLW